MKKVVIIIAVMISLMVIIVGCDPNKARREAAKQQWKITPEQGKKEAEAYTKTMEELNKYKADFGQYPESLEELKAAGYEIYPRAEGPNGGWYYRLVGGQPQLTPALPTPPSE